MKTFGNKNTQELISLVETSPRSFEDNPGYHPEQLCPIGKYWQSHPDAPWNVPAIERDPSWWKTEYPEAWAGVAVDDPSAPWNAPEPDRDPANYLDDKGEPLFWETPTIIPLVKLPKPDDTLTHYSEPKLVWFDDRVERDWEILPIPQPTAEEIASDAAKKAAAAAAAEKRRLLYLDFEIQPEGFSIATKEEDQNAFSRLHTLVTAANLPDSTELSISDSAGTLHNITVARFKEIVVAYGLEIFQRWTKYR